MLGHEQVEDVMAVCRGCHDRLHERKGRARHWGWLAEFALMVWVVIVLIELIRHAALIRSLLGI